MREMMNDCLKRLSRLIGDYRDDFPEKEKLIKDLMILKREMAKNCNYITIVTKDGER